MYNGDIICIFLLQLFFPPTVTKLIGEKSFAGTSTPEA
jgi:hypothetical protein